MKKALLRKIAVYLLFISFGLGIPEFSQCQELESRASKELKLSHELTKFRNQLGSDSVSAALKNAIFAVQNIGFNFYERGFQYDSALQVVSGVVSVWKEIKDTTNLANNLKFRGLMFAHLDNFDPGKANIKE